MPIIIIISSQKDRVNFFFTSIWHMRKMRHEKGNWLAKNQSIINDTLAIRTQFFWPYFLSEWLVEAEEGADGDGVGYTTGEGQSGTGDPPCDFESTQDAKAGDKPLSKKRNEHTDIHWGSGGESSPPIVFFSFFFLNSWSSTWRRRGKTFRSSGPSSAPQRWPSQSSPKSQGRSVCEVLWFPHHEYVNVGTLWLPALGDGASDQWGPWCVILGDGRQGRGRAAWWVGG